MGSGHSAVGFTLDRGDHLKSLEKIFIYRPHYHDLPLADPLRYRGLCPGSGRPATTRTTARSPAMEWASCCRRARRSSTRVLLILRGYTVWVFAVHLAGTREEHRR